MHANPACKLEWYHGIHKVVSSLFIRDEAAFFTFLHKKDSKVRLFILNTSDRLNKEFKFGYRIKITGMLCSKRE